MSNILEGLNEQQKQKVLRLAEKLRAKNEVSETPAPKKQRPKNANVKKLPVRNVMEDSRPSPAKSKKVQPIIHDTTVDEAPARRRAASRRGGAKVKTGREKVGTKRCRTEPLPIVERENNFYELIKTGVATAPAEDREIDKKLNRSAPTPRGGRKAILVRVKCRSCGDIEDVSPDIVPRDAKRYKCNGCSTSS